MRRLEYLRREAGLSIRGLGQMCEPPIASNYICRAEKWGDHLGEEHLQRLADALGWDKDPALLTDTIEVVEV